MLTVMHRHNDGTETVYEAKSVTRESTGKAVIPAFGDIILRGVTGGLEEKDGLLAGGPGICWEGGGTLRISEKYFTDDGFDNARVWVMNRHGATVASHVLGQPL